MLEIIVMNTLYCLSWILFGLMLNIIVVYGVTCPSYCKCHMKDSLRYVSCVDKGLINLLLDIPQTAQWIELNNNSISSIQDHIFLETNLDHLVKIDIMYSGIQEVSSLGFDGLTHLEEVNLRGNRIVYIVPTTFEFNENLVSLDLSLNFIKVPFLVSQTLQILKLSECSIDYIQSDLFSRLPSLRFLDLSSNQLMQLSNSHLPLVNLVSIDLSGNKIKCEKGGNDLVEYFNQRNIAYTGLECKKKSESKMFEKMVMIDTLQTDDFTEEEANYQDDNVKPEVEWQEQNQENYNCSNDDLLLNFKEPVIKTTEKTKLFLGKTPVLVIIFFTGFALGLIIAYATVIMSIACRRYKQQRVIVNNRLRYVAVATNNQPLQTINSCSINIEEYFLDINAPPPTYSQLFS